MYAEAHLRIHIRGRKHTLNMLTLANVTRSLEMKYVTALHQDYSKSLYSSLKCSFYNNLSSQFPQADCYNPHVDVVYAASPQYEGCAATLTYFHSKSPNVGSSADRGSIGCNFGILDDV
jgi:hypothetical protein